MDNINSMDCVFAANCKDEVEFDAIFDQEDSLIDTVNGVNESGDPLTGVEFEELHQTEDDVDAKDIKDEHGEEITNGAKNVEGTEEIKPEDNSVKNDVGEESDADKILDGAEEDYQEDKTKEVKTDEENIEDTIDKVSEDVDTLLDESSNDIDHVLDEAGEPEEDPADEGDENVATEGADADVQAEVEDEENIDDIDNVLDDSEGKKNLEYDSNDEDIINTVMGN